MTPTISETEDFIERLFEGRFDKAGRPYVEHCIRVADSLPAASSKDEVRAAMLHDVIEDTRTTADDLRGLGYSDRTVWLVERLTRPKGAAYLVYVRGIAKSGDVGLIAIKRADLDDNSNPARLALLPEAERARLMAKYAAARKILEGGE